MEGEAFLLILTSTIGFISLSMTLLAISKWIWITFFRPPKNLKDYGSWALITGSTDGIGKALAFELASMGLNIVLVGRDPLKLERTSIDIQDRNGRETQVKGILIDFSKDAEEEIVKEIEREIDGIEVGLLINNAGLGHPYPRFFHEVDLELMESIIRVNLVAATWVTKAVLPGMLKRKRGAVVNIGSGAVSAVPAYPLLTTYAATKAYLEMFSRSISLEYKQYGIDVQCQIPMVVATNMTSRSIQRSSFLIPSPQMYSKASVRQIGYEPVCIPYWSHSLQWCLLRSLPDALVTWLLLQYFLGSQRRGQLKEMNSQNKNNNS